MFALCFLFNVALAQAPVEEAEPDEVVEELEVEAEGTTSEPEEDSYREELLGVVGLLFLLVLAGRKLSPKVKESAELSTNTRASDGPQRLRATDVSVIQARLQMLGFTDQLTSAEVNSLKRTLIERCRAGHTEAWWGPVAVWLGKQRRSLPMFVVGLKVEDKKLHEHLAKLRVLADEKGLTPVSSKAIEGGQELVCRLDDREVKLSLRFVDQTLDATDLTRGLNSLAAQNNWNFRYLLLEEDQGRAAILRTSSQAADRAVRSSWGTLPT